jgi:DNA-binding transcriptional ArsR family regulator
MSRGLGKVQRDIVLEVGRFELIATNRWELGWLDYSAQSVSRAIRTLRDRGLICESDGGYKLTTQGLLEYAALVERGQR